MMRTHRPDRRADRNESLRCLFIFGLIESDRFVVAHHPDRLTLSHRITILNLVVPVAVCLKRSPRAGFSILRF